MNTVQTASSSQDKINSLIRSQKNDKLKESEVSTDTTAKQASTIKNKDQSSKSVNKSTTGDVGKEKSSEKLEINDYLKIVSRLENKLNLGEIQDDDLDKISLSLEEKILSLSKNQKTRLLNMEFFKKNGIENIKELKKTLFELFKDVDERKAMFEFLKSPEFMTILLNESGKPFTYSAANASPNLKSATKNQV